MTRNAKPPGRHTPGAETLATTKTQEWHQSNPTAAPRWTPGAIARERVRAHLRHMAASAGRPLRSRLDEQHHLAARRAGEVARMKVVGE